MHTKKCVVYMVKKNIAFCHITSSLYLIEKLKPSSIVENVSR